MSGQEAGTEAVECEEIVYRALKRSWILDDGVAAEAFICRRNETELSLSRRKYTTAQACRLKLSKMPGTASLHAGKIRSLPVELDVHPEPERNELGAIIDPGHCVLVNMPNRDTEPESAEFTASLLSRIARNVTPEQEANEQNMKNSSD